MLYVNGTKQGLTKTPSFIKIGCYKISQSINNRPFLFKVWLFHVEVVSGYGRKSIFLQTRNTNIDNLQIKLCISLEYLESSGIVKCPLCIASVLSPNGEVKKQSL